MPGRGSNSGDGHVDRHRRRQARDEGAGVECGGSGSVLGIPGISEDALSPELRAGVARLAAERDRRTRRNGFGRLSAAVARRSRSPVRRCKSASRRSIKASVSAKSGERSSNQNSTAVA